ncbi:Uma2 family endonuclease [Promineifilum sp.]|uniref:Uma2 family endonuclease n=1 Tax=Promineifilum sp. TaxID=2664178 RepID=UPI0035AEE444
MIAEPVETTVEVEFTRRRFTVTEYLRMAEVGLLAEDDRVELLWGEIAEMSPINIAHTSTLNRLVWVLTNALGKQAIVSVQNPVQLSGESLPQPDIAVLRFREDFYSEHHAQPEDILLLIEVADTSLSYDRRVKGALYGSAGVPDYWIVNLSARQIEVYREPRPDGYRTITIYAPGEMLSPLAFADVALNVREILGTSA